MLTKADKKTSGKPCVSAKVLLSACMQGGWTPVLIRVTEPSARFMPHLSGVTVFICAGYL